MPEGLTSESSSDNESIPVPQHRRRADSPLPSPEPATAPPTERLSKKARYARFRHLIPEETEDETIEDGQRGEIQVALERVMRMLKQTFLLPKGKSMIPMKDVSKMMDDPETNPELRKVWRSLLRCDTKLKNRRRQSTKSTDWTAVIASASTDPPFVNYQDVVDAMSNLADAMRPRRATPPLVIRSIPAPVRPAPPTAPFGPSSLALQSTVTTASTPTGTTPATRAAKGKAETTKSKALELSASSSSLPTPPTQSSIIATSLTRAAPTATSTVTSFAPDSTDIRIPPLKKLRKKKRALEMDVDAGDNEASQTNGTVSTVESSVRKSKKRAAVDGGPARKPKKRTKGGS